MCNVVWWIFAAGVENEYLFWLWSFVLQQEPSKPAV
jgi:hypothetical protein